MPTTTSPSMLARVRDPADAAAWRAFDTRYGPLVVRYCCSRGVQHADAEDLRQIVMSRLARSMARFEYAPRRGRFRSYFGRVVQNELRRFLRCPRRPLPGVYREQAVDDGWETVWDREWTHHHLRLATERLRGVCDPETLEVFHLLLGGASVADVATATGKSAAAVQKVKQRCRDRLRRFVAEQVGEEDD